HPTSQVYAYENNTSKARSGGARTRREPQCAGDWGQDVPVTGTAAQGILIATPRGGSGQSNRSPQARSTHLRRSSRIAATLPGTMRDRWAPGAAGAEAFAELQSCAPDGGGAALPGRARARSRSANGSCQGASAGGFGGGAAGARGKPSSDWTS
ncbi:Hypothetical predicted protein, partial [Marmota monax]